MIQTYLLTPSLIPSLLSSVYDVTSRASFESLPTWFTELETFSTSPDIIKCIVGNKVDKDLSRVVTTQEGQQFADSKGAIFVEASAKKGVGVQGAFDDLVHRIISTPSLWQSTTTGTRPGDRMPGGAPADHAATSTTGNISLASGYEAARSGCASC